MQPPFAYPGLTFGLAAYRSELGQRASPVRPGAAARTRVRLSTVWLILYPSSLFSNTSNGHAIALGMQDRAIAFGERTYTRREIT